MNKTMLCVGVLILLFTDNILCATYPRIIDLGHVLSDDIPVLPLPGFTSLHLNPIQTGLTPQGFWLAYNKFESVEHVGTHMDAPYEFNPYGWTVDEIPQERLFAPASVIDIRPQIAKNSSYTMSAQDVRNWVNENGMFPNMSIILVHTGWSLRYSDPVAYLGNLTDELKLIYPGTGVDAVEEILKYRDSHDIHIVGFGIDGPSLDNGLPPRVYPSHRLTHSQNIYIIENMKNLESLPATGTRLMVMPMNLKNGSGAPARVMARLPHDEI